MKFKSPLHLLGLCAALLSTLAGAQAASISGSVFFDLNGNGARDAVSEYGLPQWSLQLVPVSPAGPTLSANTDVNGRFSFASLAPGSYTLSAVHPSPWFQTYPAATGPHQITLAADDTVTGKDFGSKLPVRVPQVEWQGGFGGSGGDRVYARAVQTTDGGYLIGGSSNSRPGGVKTSPNWGASDFCVVRLDAFGNQIWDASFGGDGDEWIASMLQTSDGEFILGGVSTSGVSGNKTSQSYGGWDIWLVKIDAQGNKVWDRSFGGSGTDQIGDGSARLGSVVETHDHGLLICGYSSSGSDGTKTSPNRGGSDGWVIRLDANAVPVWDRSYGSIDTDLLLFAAENVDGTFLLGGGSYSGPGGNKTSANYGGEDYWLLKITSDGTPLWDRSFGGDSCELLTSAAATADGGMALGGVTCSGISGNKTAARLSMSEGDQDAWIMRVDGNGDRVWDHSYGGRVDNWLHDLQTTDDGGFFFVGRNNSPISGNKVSPLVGGQSAWLVKTDAAGNSEWDQSFGVPGGAWFAGVTLTTDGGALLVGNVGLHNDGNITTRSYGSLDFWVLKLASRSCASSPLTLVAATADCAQHKITVNFSAALDSATALQAAHYALAGGAASVQAVSFGASTLQVVLDVPGLLPAVTYTIVVQGVADDCGNAIAADAQLTVVCPGQIRGKVFADQNSDCTANGTDFGVFPWPVKLEPGPRYTLTDGAGNYSFSVPAGAYTVSAPASPASPWNLTCPPTPGTRSVSVADGQIVGGKDFGLRSKSPTPCADLCVNLSAFYPGPKLVHIAGGNTPCCGTNFFYHLDFGNNGANPSTLPATVSLPLPDNCTFVSASPPSTAFWTVGYQASGNQVDVVFNQPVPASPYQKWVDIEVHLDCNITNSCTNQTELWADATFRPLDPSEGECFGAWDNNYSCQHVTPCCSFDPNDCTVEPKGCGPEGYVNRDQALTYLVQFQNLGGGAAHLVIVRNDVDADLDLNTLEILGSSHPNLLEQNGRELKWIFPDIELASAGVDERASHGYVKFRLRPRADAPAGAVLNNSAEIFFDYNAPITTIVTTNTITDNPLPVAAFRVVPQRGSASRTNDFLYTGGTLGAQYQWYFGPNAIPQTSTEANPTGIVFTRPGRNLVSLRVSLGDCVVQSPVKVITVGQPRLGIAKAGNEVALSWQGDGYVVQEAASLTTPIQWQTLPATPLALGSRNYITVPAPTGARFYRLTDTP